MLLHVWTFLTTVFANRYVAFLYVGVLVGGLLTINVEGFASLMIWVTDELFNVIELMTGN